MGLPHHASIFHHGDAFQPSVWVRRHGPSRDPRSSPRFLGFVAEESNEERKVNLDLIDEAREEARIKAEAVKKRVERQYSSKMKLRPGHDEGSPLRVRKQVVSQVDWTVQSNQSQREWFV